MTRSGFAFNPQKPDFSLNVNDIFQKTIIQNNLNSTDTPYTPKCNDKSLLVETHHRQVEEYANLYGMIISYQPKIYNYNTHNFLYGEDPSSGFYPVRKIKAIIDQQSYTSFLSKFGIMSDLDLIAYIPIRTFNRIWGNDLFPVMGDLFRIDNTACNRPRGQGPIVLEVTDAQDHVHPVDFMAGNYTWKLTCKRYDESYEPNAPSEIGDTGGLGDSGNYGLSGNETIVGYPQKADDIARKDFENRESDTYGNYL